MKQLIIDEVLQNVQKPSRYLGNELNAVHKDPAMVDVRIAMAFPDLYDLGLSNIGMMILYRVLNELPGVWCERVYAPAMDMEAELRARGIPLFTLESTTPLRQFDCVGFTLQYELCYTNIVNMMDMAGIPLLSNERGDADPIIVAGGPCAFSPEPIADLLDAIIIGDGEDAVIALAHAIRAGKGLPRERRLDLLEAVPGIYIPARFPTVTLADGGVIRDPARPPVKKALIPDLNKVPFPTDYIVPYVQQVHDRVSLEVLRGCTQGCRFCQAGMIYRPVRERSLENIKQLTEEAIQKSGYEEISLSSLSTCDYSQVKALVEQQVRVAGPKGVGVSLPSLRMDSFSIDLAEMINGVRKTGLTFAPEAASDRLRAVIDKWIPDEELFNTTSQVYERGWARGSTALLRSYKDILTNEAANATLAEFVRRKIRATVRDPAVAALLTPTDHGIGTKRICLDTDYYETYNRPNVRLVDLRRQPIEAVTPHGIRAGGEHIALDDIAFATGFDAITGAPLAIDIGVEGGARLAEAWADGARAYLGLMVAGFPNLFLLTGPGSPSVLANMITGIEQHVEWVADCLRALRERGLTRIEAEASAEEEWVQHVDRLAHATLMPQAKSWFSGANIPGKPRRFLPYVGGHGQYRMKCDDVAFRDYEGFVLG